MSRRAAQPQGESHAVSRPFIEAPPTSGGWWFGLAVVVPFIVYLRTLAPTVYGLDSAELSTGAYVLGIVHPPGSPFYLLLGHLFTWLPVGDVGYRLNLFSATAAALAIGFVYSSLCQLTGRRVLALAGAWFLAFSYYFWIPAVAAELYALHHCIVAALILLGLAWRVRQQAWQLCVFALLFGLGLGNHLSLIMLAPGFGWLLFREIAIGRRGRLLAAAAACGLAGLSIYVYLPLRAAASMNYARSLGADVTTWEGFWWMVSGQKFSGLFFGVPAASLPLEIGHYLYRLWSNFFGLGCLLGLVGLLADYRRRPAIHVALSLMFAGHLLFGLTYNVPDRELMLGPTYLIWALWITLGIEPVMNALKRVFQLAQSPSAAVALMAMSAGNLMVTLPYADISADRSARERGERIFAALPANAMYVGTWSDAPVLEYLQLVEGRRLDVRVVNLFFFRNQRRLALIEEMRRTPHPVYTSPAKYFSQVPPTFGDLSFEDVPVCHCRRLRTARADTGQTGQER